MSELTNEFEFNERSRNMRSPLVSVIVTTYGDSSTLARAIDSALCQSYTNLEVIVVDDNGDGTVARSVTERVMARYSGDKKVIYLTHPANLNGSAARNTGIRQAQGDYITFLDNDDVLLGKRIENAVVALDGNGAGAYFCDVLLVVNDCYACVKTRDALTWKDLVFSSSCIGTGSNLFFRRDVVENTGLFDVSFKRNQDIEYALRVLLEHDAVWGKTLDIVKCSNATNNEQKLDAYIMTKEHFDDVFSAVIGRLDAREEVKRKVNRAREILYFACKEGNRIACMECFQCLRSLGYPAGKLAEYKTMLRCSNTAFSSGLEAVARRLRHFRVKHSLDDEVKSEISKKLSWS